MNPRQNQHHIRICLIARWADPLLKLAAFALTQALEGSSGFTLSADQFVTTFNIYEHPILKDVRTLLVPDAQSVRARLHQLTVHGPGGGFVLHKVHAASHTWH